MPYAPNHPDASQRGMVFVTIWIGAASAVLNLAFALTSVSHPVVALAFAGTFGGLFNGCFARRTDDYFRALCETGMRWLLGGLTAYVAAFIVIYVIHWSHSFGASLANPDLTTLSPDLSLLMLDARTVTAALAALFYAGYAFAWSKDRWGQ